MSNDFKKYTLYDYSKRSTSDINTHARITDKKPYESKLLNERKTL